jgi:hypothetical protein
MKHKRIKGPIQMGGKYSKSPSQRQILTTWANVKLETADACSFKPFSTRATDNKAFWDAIPEHHKRLRKTDGVRQISSQARAVFAHAFLTGDEDTPRMAALTTGLFLCLTAPDETRARETAETCEGIAVGLTPEQVEHCKAEAEQMCDERHARASSTAERGIKTTYTLKEIAKHRDTYTDSNGEEAANYNLPGGWQIPCILGDITPGKWTAVARDRDDELIVTVTK